MRNCLLTIRARCGPHLQKYSRKVLRYETAKALDSFAGALLISRNDLAQVLRIHARRKCCRTDEVGEHHGDLAALGGVLRDRGSCGPCRSLSSIFLTTREFGYRSEQLKSMTQGHPDLSKVLIGQIGQDGKADVVLGKALRVLPETELLKPVSDLLHRGNAPGLSGLTRPHRRVYPERVQRWSRGRDLLAARKSASLQDITTSSARWKR